MALRTKHKLFPVGRSVWCVVPTEVGNYRTVTGIVCDTGKGYIYA